MCCPKLLGPQLDTLWWRNSQEVNSHLLDVPEALPACGHQNLVAIQSEISFQSASLSCTASHMDLRVLHLRCRLLLGQRLHVAFSVVSTQCLADRRHPVKASDFWRVPGAAHLLPW